MGIKTYREYQERHREDSCLHATPMTAFKMTWYQLMGKEFYKTAAECADAVRRLNIDTITECNRKYKQDPRLPASPLSSYGVTWTKITGKTVPDFYPTVGEWRRAVRDRGIEGIHDYQRKRKQDPRLHSVPWDFYDLSWKILRSQDKRYDSRSGASGRRKKSQETRKRGNCSSRHCTRQEDDSNGGHRGRRNYNDEVKLR